MEKDYQCSLSKVNVHCFNKQLIQLNYYHNIISIELTYTVEHNAYHQILQAFEDHPQVLKFPLGTDGL